MTPFSCHPPLPGAPAGARAAKQNKRMRPAGRLTYASSGVQVDSPRGTCTHSLGAQARFPQPRLDVLHHPEKKKTLVGQSKGTAASPQNVSSLWGDQLVRICAPPGRRATHTSTQTGTSHVIPLSCAGGLPKYSQCYIVSVALAAQPLECSFQHPRTYPLK